tara:strand:+ start:124 stop:540 length:417 start_codon:yes stop_codon:yes gene_type:complete
MTRIKITKEILNSGCNLKYIINTANNMYYEIKELIIEKYKTNKKIFFDVNKFFKIKKQKYFDDDYKENEKHVIWMQQVQDSIHENFEMEKKNKMYSVKCTIDLLKEDFTDVKIYYKEQTIYFIEKEITEKYIIIDWSN